MKDSMENIIETREEMIEMPKVGDVISGRVIDKAKNAMYLDLGYLGVGVIYGRDFVDDMRTFNERSLGDEVKATVQRLDNEDDLIELSIRSATLEQSWGELRKMMENDEVVETEIMEANKGGLIVKVNGIIGFLPVSQLAPEHYPRVEGGDKNIILERLKEYVQQKFKVKVISVDQGSEKLIVSEKAVVSDEISEALGKVHVGDKISGVVSGVVDFGVFVKFKVGGSELEGLAHISELAWQRINDPNDVVSIGDKVRAKVIAVDGLRISLSLKQLQDDPWAKVGDKYKVGDTVEGEIMKVTSFGGFIKLDESIHGLIHVSELPEVKDKENTKLLLVGEKKKFKIISLQPSEHRLGLGMIKKEEK